MGLADTRSMTDIARNLLTIRARIKSAAQNPAKVGLIAVSKGQGAEKIALALAAGQKTFGENRVQEAKAKFTALRAAHKGLGLHLIGPLQTNKALEAVQLFDVIETLDRPRLAEALMKAVEKTGRKLEFFIEINIGAEPQKAGIAPEELGSFLQFCRAQCGLNVTGLMCIPPHGRDPAPFFKRMKELADRFSLPRLSMGMSGDFEEAIRQGATDVRVGTAIFGNREN